jgi:hypothetical protein
MNIIFRIGLCLVLFLWLALQAGAQSNRTTVTSQSTKADFSIVPGKSLGKIRLGMTTKEVVALLGNPGKTQKEQQATLITYQSKKSGNQVGLYLEADRVVQIHFTSPAYATQEGITNLNCSEHKPLFTAWQLPVRFLNLKYTRNGGGVTFYNLNADSGDAAYPVSYWGVIHAGPQPRYELFSLENEPNGGWQPWDGKYAYSE